MWSVRRMTCSEKVVCLWILCDAICIGTALSASQLHASTPLQPYAKMSYNRIL